MSKLYFLRGEGTLGHFIIMLFSFNFIGAGTSNESNLIGSNDAAAATKLSNEVIDEEDDIDTVPGVSMKCNKKI